MPDQLNDGVPPADPDATTPSPRVHETMRFIGPYRLLERVGEGGMGEVWLAEQTQPVRRQVALKVIKAGMDTVQVVTRFEAERQALALMDHPAIATVFDGGSTPEGRPFFAMEYVRGEPITVYCDQQRLGMADRLNLFIHVCEGVQHAHQKGVIHRDLKPSNVLVALQDGRPVPKIIDFGVAKATTQHLTERTLYTELGAWIGTPEYMSPEQADLTGLDIDTRSDVYALGVLLYELLTGALPFDRQMLREKAVDELRRTIRESDPPKPSTRVTQLGPASTDAARNRHTEVRRLASELRGDLDWITMKCLEKDRTRRYGSASDLANDIRRHLDLQPVLAGPPSPLYRLRKFVRRHQFGVATAAAVGLLLVAFAVTMAVQARRVARERDRAESAARKAEHINAFVVGMLGSADPRLSGRNVTVASVLDAARGRADSELAGQPDVRAAVLTTLGTTYEGLGLYTPARETLKAALDATIACYGAEHVEVARALDRLAGATEDEGSLAEAERLERAALAMLQRVGAAAGADAARVQANLARVLSGLGQSQAAETLYRETLAIERRVYGDRDATVAATLNNLGVLLGQRGDWNAAEPLHREALDTIRAVRGPEHPEVAAALNTLGSVLEAKGDIAGAERLYREGLAMRRKLLGPEHPDTTRSMYALAYLLRSKGDPAGAAQLGREVIALRGRVLPDAHPMVAGSMIVVGLSLLDLGRASEAEALLRESLELRQQTLPPDHWLIASSQSVLGGCLTAERRYSEAERLLLQAYASLAAALGPDHPRTVECCQRLGVLYASWGRPEKAAEWHAKLPKTAGQATVR